MQKTISKILLLCVIFSFCTSTAHADYDGDILFNDIPWGTTYKDVLETLTEKYDVEFGEPKMNWWNNVKADEVLSKAGIFFDEEIPFSTYYGFSVSSLQTAMVAGFPAIITLNFLYDNNGNQVKNDTEDIEDAILSNATYTFYKAHISPNDEKQFELVNNLEQEEIDRLWNDIPVKLESLYGKFTTNGVFETYIYGRDKDTSLVINLNMGVTVTYFNEANDLLINKDKKLIEQRILKYANQRMKELEREQAEKNEEAKKDTSGL